METARSNATLWSCVLLAAFASTAVAQQASVVPTDYYGPPVCAAGARPPARSGAQETPRARAEREQNDALTDAHILSSAEPLPNFGVERYRLSAYGDCTGESGCYWADLDAQYRRAEAELASRITEQKAAGGSAEKLAIVMDIDETTLTNYCEMRREDFGYIGPMYSAWETSPEAATAIPGALRLFREARAAGVAVFFISGRGGVPDYSAAKPATDETEATARNLEAAGFHGWAGLQLRNGGERLMPTITFKSSERDRIVHQGYRIILSVGDQWSDLLGEPKADVSIKLPNPFYFIP